MGQMRFILGRAGSGKTGACLELAVRELKKSPLVGPAVILLVPEQATFQMSRMLAGWDGLGGYVRGRVLSFKKLAQSVVTEVNGAKRPMLGFSRKLMMQQILAAVQEELTFWKKTPPEQLAGSLLTLLDELSQARLGTQELSAIYEKMAAEDEQGELSGKLGDLVRLSREYERMNLVGLEDPGNYLGQYRELIGQVEWLKGASLYVDGFSGFTGQEYAALLATIDAAKETFVTLSLDPEQLGKEGLADEEKVFWPGEQTYFRLLELAKSAGITVGEPVMLDSNQPRRFEHNATLMGLEKFLGGGKTTADPMETNEAVMIVSAENPAHEVELAAGKILQLVREQGMQFREISVILRETEGYEHLLRYVFDHYKIPYFLDIRRPIGQHPLTRLILSAVGAMAGDFDSEWILRGLKTGLTNCPNDVADRMENYVQANGIDGEGWQREWKYKLELIGVEEDQPEAGGEAFDLRTLNKYRRELIKPMEKLERFWGKERESEQEFSIEILLEGLMEFLRELEVAKKLSDLAILDDSDQTGQIHQQILNVVSELSDQLRITLAGEMISLGKFLTILTESFSELSVGVIPSNVDQVLIGTIERSRHPAVRASLVLGFNEGKWPSPLEEDVMLTDRERVSLAWQDLAVKGDIDEHFLNEQYLMYIAMTRSSEFLWISFSRKDGKGNERSPSRYLRRVEHFLKNIKPVSVTSRDAELFWDALTPLPMSRERLVSEVVTAIGSEDDKIGFWLGLAGALRKRLHAGEIVKRYVDGLCDANLPTLEPGLAKQLYRNRVSFSQLESFYACRFQHFCKYGLRLRELPRFKLEPMDMGSFRHEVMKLAWQSAATDEGDWNERAKSQVQQIVAAAVKTAATEVKGEILFHNARNRYILFRTQTELSMAMAEQLRMLGPGRFKPGAFETDFAFGIEHGGNRYDLVGRIDRIDFAAMDGSEWAMIIDYKSGRTTFSLNDLMAGTQLQLPGYLMVATSEGENRFAGGGLFLPLRPQKAKGNDQDSMMSNFPASGMINAEALELMVDPETGLYPYGIKVKKDGTISQTGTVMVTTWNVIEGILKKTYEMVTEAIASMAEGKIEIRPYFDGKVSVCPMCDMRGVCRFSHSRNRYRGGENLTKEEILSAMGT
jgi:ATP-dependent helicase/nuclease subunit B